MFFFQQDTIIYCKNKMYPSRNSFEHQAPSAAKLSTAEQMLSLSSHLACFVLGFLDDESRLRGPSFVEEIFAFVEVLSLTAVPLGSFLSPES